jgi:dTDP-4-dehydrorhamnose reductase
LSQVLVTGKNGLVGQNIANTLKAASERPLGTVYSRARPGDIVLDITKFDQVKALFEKTKLSAVFHCVNMSGGVNRCESEPELAGLYHLDSVKNLVDLCVSRDLPFVFISTDYVFDNNDKPVKENHSTRPLNIYGQLKLEAEKYIQGSGVRSIIARTTGIYGYDPDTQTPNFFMQVLRNLQKGKQMTVPSCLYGTPTNAESLAQVLVDLYQRREWGLYHIVGDEYLNRYEWAQMVAQKLNYDEKLIIESKDQIVAVNRPENLRLDNSFFKQKTDIRIKTLVNFLGEHASNLEGNDR